MTIATVTRTAGDASSGAASGSTGGAPAAPEGATGADPTSTPQPPAQGSTALTGFIYPISGACLPQGDQLMPNAAREYRLGIHEGIDFYGVDNCVAIGAGTPVIAAKAGTVIRVDTGYVDLTQQTLSAILANPTTEGSFDAFRGRQVWIDHGRGIVTRYAHLEGIPADIVEGRRVVQGEVVGYIGDSGTPESISTPDQEIHLHWELRVGDDFLGAGLPPEDVRAIYEGLFEPIPTNATFQ
jgi:murein DD-endopeptidase MepM/ murein hydrolase activator NlpD